MAAVVGLGEAGTSKEFFLVVVGVLGSVFWSSDFSKSNRSGPLAIVNLNVFTS